MSNWQEFLTKKNVLALLGLVLVAVVLPLATVLVQQSQETRKKAAACPLGASSRSSVRFVNLNGQPISSAVLNDRVRLEVNVGAVDAADVVLGFNNNKLEFDTAFGTNGIQKSSAGGLAHFGNSGGVDPAPGRTDVTRILFMVQRARGATATGGKIATIGFKVKSGVASDTTQVIYGEKTTLALNGEGGHLECGTGATLALNGSGATATPTLPAGGANHFYLSNDGSSAVAGTFTTDVYFNSQGVSTKNFQISYGYETAKIKSPGSSVVNGSLFRTTSDNSGTRGYVLFSNAATNTTARVYGTAGGAGEKIGTITFQFQGTNKQANLTFDSALSGSWIINNSGSGVKTAVNAPNYCYFMTGGTCAAASPTPTPTGPTATPTTPAATNTPAPTATPIVFPTTTPVAGFNALYVSDDLPNSVTPGQTFTAHIRMKNSGTNYWGATEGLSSVPFGSATWRSSGMFLPAGTIINTDREYTFTLNLTAPATAGTYDSFWKMVQGGTLFGQQGGKRIVVAAAASPTPTTPACPRGVLGNLDCSADGKIDSSDLSVLLASWSPNGPVPTPAAGRRSADIAGGANSGPDGQVDTSDLTKLLQNWGTGQ